MVGQERQPVRVVGDAVPRQTARVVPTSSVREVSELMQRDQAWAVAVTDDDGDLVGLATGHDLVAGWLAAGPGDEPGSSPVETCLSRDPATVEVSASVVEALRVMTGTRRTKLVVVDDDGSVVGVLRVSDIARNLRRDRAGDLLAVLSRGE